MGFFAKVLLQDPCPGGLPEILTEAHMEPVGGWQVPRLPSGSG